MGCGGEGGGGVVEGLRYEADLNMSCHGRESCLEFGSVYGTNSIFSDFKFLRRERERRPNNLLQMRMGLDIILL